MPRALLLVDPQTDFITGSLPVPGAAAAMDALAGFLQANPDRYALKIVTLDWHPWNHSSFKKHGGQWPPHCLSYTQGAAIWPALAPGLAAGGAELAFMPKGCSVDKDEFSIFQNEAAARRVSSLLKKARIREVELCGLAGDVCVLATFKDALAMERAPAIRLLKEFSPSLDGGKALSECLES